MNNMNILNGFHNYKVYVNIHGNSTRKNFKREISIIDSSHSNKTQNSMHMMHIQIEPQSYVARSVNIYSSEKRSPREKKSSYFWKNS